VPAEVLGLPETTWFPQVTVVVEGQARATENSAPDVRIVRADGSGDDTIADEAARLVASGRTVTVVTSDRGLAERARYAGAEVRGSRWLLELLD
jgi:rRNA-processing protein FCF1